MSVDKKNLIVRARVTCACREDESSISTEITQSQKDEIDT